MKVNPSFKAGTADLPNTVQKAVIPQMPPRRSNEYMSSEASMAARAYAMPQVSFGFAVNATFEAEMLPNALKAFKKLPKDQRKLLRSAYESFKQNGFNNIDTKRLKGLKDVFEFKVGKWRCLFTYGPDNKIYIDSIHRKESRFLPLHEVKAAEKRLQPYANAA